MARQIRGLDSLDFNRNRLGLGLWFIFVLALIANVALSASIPAQNIRSKRENDETVKYDSFNSSSEDDAGPAAGKRETENTDKVRDDNETNNRKRFPVEDFEDPQTNNHQSEDSLEANDSSSPNTSTDADDAADAGAAADIVTRPTTDDITAAPSSAEVDLHSEPEQQEVTTGPSVDGHTDVGGGENEEEDDENGNGNDNANGDEVGEEEDDSSESDNAAADESAASPGTTAAASSTPATKEQTSSVEDVGGILTAVVASTDSPKSVDDTGEPGISNDKTSSSTNINVDDHNAASPPRLSNMATLTICFLVVAFLQNSKCTRPY